MMDGLKNSAFETATRDVWKSSLVKVNGTTRYKVVGLKVFGGVPRIWQ
jgi:hypothetical protein